MGEGGEGGGGAGNLQFSSRRPFPTHNVAEPVPLRTNARTYRKHSYGFPSLKVEAAALAAVEFSFDIGQAVDVMFGRSPMRKRTVKSCLR